MNGNGRCWADHSRAAWRAPITLLLSVALLACGAVNADAGPTQWIDAAALQTPRFGTVQFQGGDGKRLTAYVYRATQFDPVAGRIWFVMHGAGRNAQDYLEYAAPMAERHDALAIAIEFSERDYPRSEDYTLRAEGYAEIERVFDAVRAELGGKQSGYYLFGHSAGAQFTHRLVTFLTAPRVLAAVAANAGWYTLPVASSAAHHRTPYGLTGTPLEKADLGPLFAMPLTVMLGERDLATPTTDPLLRGTPEAMVQGATRFARGQYYFTTARTAAASKGKQLNWRLAVVPRAGHEASQVMASAGFFLFRKEAPCTASRASAATGLVINELLADPPDGGSGDANVDGTRDPSNDEFVELVNNGSTAICLSGWTLGDAKQRERHVFPLGAALAPRQSLVVFGGGVPTGAFGGANVQTAAFDGRLNLSNEGDVLTLRDATGAVARQISWGNCDGARCAREHYKGGLGIASSLVRRPELTGTWTAHRAASSRLFSPGVRTDGSVFK